MNFAAFFRTCLRLYKIRHPHIYGKKTTLSRLLSQTTGGLFFYFLYCSPPLLCSVGGAGRRGRCLSRPFTMDVFNFRFHFAGSWPCIGGCILFPHAYPHISTSRLFCPDRQLLPRVRPAPPASLTLCSLLTFNATQTKTKIEL